ncbi:Anhydro-N-acetylmuramic acid kinase [Frankliniella fusca]|uniref:Anhydro-N-acetylmuramic acid kinase n=1 Tax=Frankliniella fusca TaxID=407009 RepID=A0AAE1LGV0_9NEOP|nr:Anhydro-N-acetylmuramic acid kinase [Frankliniella fusca]
MDPARDYTNGRRIHVNSVIPKKVDFGDMSSGFEDYADVVQRVDVCLQPLPKTWGSFVRPRQEALKDAEYAIRHGFAKEKIIKVIDERMAIYPYLIDGTMWATVNECLYASLP